MFRRINAYTAPLNSPEKRHSKYNGKFKWYITELADRYSPLLEEFGIFTPKQMVRMADAEFLGELAVVVERGIVNRSETEINKVYGKYDESFDEVARFERPISGFFDLLSGELEPLRSTFMMKSYAVHSLFCALTQRRYGIPGGDDTVRLPSDGRYLTDARATLTNLEALAAAHEGQDIEGPQAEYAKACLATTHRRAQRGARSQAIAAALV